MITRIHTKLAKCCLATLAVFSITFVGCQQDASEDRVAKPQPKWFSNVVIYNVDVDSFKDSDENGVGDFKGLTQKLGYLDSLNIDVIWLSPFQPTPDDDDGYDISDFYDIDPRLGTNADFEVFMKAAKSKGLKVIMDLVLNHTSVAHPWFKASRADTTSKYHQWYVWSKEQPKDWDKGMVFPGTQTETWTYDEPTKKYYFHRFYDFQPDLNYENKEVQKMAKDVLGYWLKKGLDGFRLDAVPFIIDKPKTSSDKPEHMFEILDQLSKAAKEINPEVILLGEANVTAEENAAYFGQKGDRLQMMFNFFANQHLFYSLAKNDPKVFTQALEDFKKKPGNCQWVFFLRNHDEIDLDRLKDNQRKLVYEKFGPEKNMQLYDRGIRRRLAPMLGDSALIKMSYSLLFSLPGAQVIRYGEEIGMGDDLTLRERLSVRTPMQWDTTFNAGFSKAKNTFRPVINGGDYGYKKVNVAHQSQEEKSLLRFMTQLIALRKQHPEIGLGNWNVEDGGKEIFAMNYEYGDKRLFVLHNFSNAITSYEIKNERLKGRKLKPIFGNALPPNAGRTQGKSTVNLPPYGYQWYQITN